MQLTANINCTDIEPFKSYLIQMTTHADYIAQKAVRTAMEQRVLETHMEFMKQLERV